MIVSSREYSYSGIKRLILNMLPNRSKYTCIPLFSFQNKGVNSIDENDCNIIQENIILAGAEIKDTTFLTQKMRTFLTKFGYPLYPTKALPKGAVIERLPAVNVTSDKAEY